MRRFLFVTTLGLGCLLATCLCGNRTHFSPLFEGQAQGQDDTKSKSKNSKSKAVKSSTKKKAITNVQGLDVRAEQAQSTFVKEAEDLAGQYTDAGHHEKAKSILQSALALNPDSEELKQKIKKLDETILTSNDFEVEVNPSRPWEPANAAVFENRPIRFQVDGSYRFVTNATVGAAGFPDKDAVKEMVASIPCGALMGVILADGKPGKPFLIGDGRDYTPKESGLLFLRVNSPPDNKNTGKLKVVISGYVKPPSASN